MKRFSTGVLAVLTAAVGLTMASAAVPGAAQGNIRTYAHASALKAKTVAQATTSPAAAMPAASTASPAAMASAAAPAATTAPAAAPAAPAAAPAAAPPPADFGAPPSAEVPILFNDRHVYAKPDRLKQGRVLAALVRGSTVLVPMRSMFEQMGATVSFDAANRVVDVMKAGSDVKVTVGKPEVVINGESRPLDVPPEIYKGVVVVPLRVLSEGMGAYVQWVAEKRTVVVRYLAAPVPSPPPTTEPTAAPTEAASAAPSAAPTKAAKVRNPYETFIVGDYINNPKVYNNFSPGNQGKASFRVAGAQEFKAFNVPWMIEGDFRSYRYPHLSRSAAAPCPTFDQSCVKGIGRQGSVFVPSFNARDDDFDGRFGLKVADPRIYIGVGYLFRNSNYEGGAFETQQHGLGGGVEMLPSFDRVFSLYGSVYYFPNVRTNGNQVIGPGVLGTVEYRILRYNVGGTFNFGNSPIFLDLGFAGDSINVKQNAPVGQTHSGPYAGLGIHF